MVINELLGAKMNTTSERLVYSIKQACDALCVGRTKLYQLIAGGFLDARALGGRTVVTADSLNAFLAALPPAQIRKSARGDHAG